MPDLVRGLAGLDRGTCPCLKCSKQRDDQLTREASAYDRGYAAGAQHVAFSTYEENIKVAALDRALADGWATGEWRVVSCDYEENRAGRRATPMPAPALRPVDTARPVSGSLQPMPDPYRRKLYSLDEVAAEFGIDLDEDHIERGRE